MLLGQALYIDRGGSGVVCDVEAEGDRTCRVNYCNDTTCGTQNEQDFAKFRRSKLLPLTALVAPGQEQTPSEQKKDPISHKKYALCMHQISSDLRLVMECWDELPETVKSCILAIVHSINATAEPPADPQKSPAVGSTDSIVK